MARAIETAAKVRRIATADAVEFRATPGKGAQAKVENAIVVVGNAAMMENVGIDVTDSALLKTDGDAHETIAGHTVVYIAVADVLAGAITLADRPRPSSKDDIAHLRRRGLQVVMLTGDSWGAAEAVAHEVGIETVHAEVLPGDKSAVIQRMQRKGLRVVMVGDGVNDAPALAAADVGIAIASGTHVAAESADMVLMRSQLSDVARAMELSRAVMRTIRQNLFWAFFYNAVGIPVAAGILYLFGGPLLDPMMASLAMAFSSVSVVANALRLRRFA